MEIEEPFELDIQYTNWLHSQPEEEKEQFKVVDAEQLLWNILWLKQELKKNTDSKLRTSLFQVSDIIKLIDEAFKHITKKEVKPNSSQH